LTEQKYWPFARLIGMKGRQNSLDNNKMAEIRLNLAICTNFFLLPVELKRHLRQN
jgi:hypothetical protein